MAKDKKMKVLIVEDDQLLAKALESMLIQEDFDVVLAKDGERALEAAKSELPSIILLDLLLPIMSGFEVLSSLKLGTATKHIPVLILSNLGQAEEIERGESLGANGYLVKSDVSLKTVMEQVHKLIEENKNK